MYVLRSFFLVPRPVAAVAVGLAVTFCAPAFAAAPRGALFKCAGEPVTYTTDAATALENACLQIDSPLIATRSRTQRARPVRPLVATQAPRAARTPPRAPVAWQPETASVRTASFVALPTALSSPYVVPADVQQRRDRDRLGILQDELARERVKLERFKTRLAQLRTPGGNGKIDTSQAADAELAVARSEIDITALTREVGLASR